MQKYYMFDVYSIFFISLTATVYALSMIFTAPDYVDGIAAMMLGLATSTIGGAFMHTHSRLTDIETKLESLQKLHDASEPE